MMSAKKEKSSLNILFININPRPKWTKDVTMLHFPTGICTIISAAKRNGFKYDLLDLMIEPKSENQLREFIGRKRYDIVAFGSLLHAYWIVKPLAAMVKEIHPNSLVIVGNYVSTLIPEKLLAWTKADIAVIGEGEFTFIEVLNRILAGGNLDGIKGIVHKKHGKIIREEPRIPLTSLDKTRFPDWEVLDVEAYINSAKNLKSHRFFKDITKLRSMPIITTKGCPFRCTFCTNNQYWRYNPYRRHSPEYVISMMKMLQNKFNINYFKFADELSFAHIKELKALFDIIRKEKFKALFEIIIRVGLFKKDDLPFAKKLREAGFVMMNYSLESANTEILKAMNKRISVKEFSEQKEVLDKAGIVSGTNVVIGYPQETEASIAETFNVCYDNNILPSVGFLLPAPGSYMYDHALKYGYIKDEEKYIMAIGEQQFINLNMTCMSNETLFQAALYHLKRIRDKLCLDISDDHLICSIVLKDETSDE